MRHRPLLDGVRALAILFVLFHHGQLLPLGLGSAGGTVGVTTLFVLSGYLITALLLNEMEATDTVDPRAFYVRRIRRLIPAFAIVVVTSAVVLVAVGRSMLALLSSLGAASFIGNWLLAGGFPLGPLAHTWFLAIEAQFYLTWPLAIVPLASHLGRGRLAGLLLLGALGITIARTVALASGWSIQRVGYATEFQADGLMIGCVLALAAPRIRLPRVAIAGGVAGLIALTLSPMTVATWPLTMVAAAGLVAGSFGPNDRFVGPILASAPVVYLGRISYGIFLWHYPLMWHLDLIAGPRHPLLALGAIAITLVIADTSHRLIERRFLGGRLIPRRA